jgi:small subunit ribosomal protein S6
MSRTYELGVVFEPRQSDDDVGALVTKYREMIENGGGKITEEDNWGKRRLAYPIQKFNEGKYIFLFVESEGGVNWPPIERNLLQNEKVLRHLVVRTDLDLKRAATKAAKRGKPEETPERASAPEGDAEQAEE